MASAAAVSAIPAEPQPLTGVRLIVAAFALALANFVVVLDTTIANVSVPHIAGGLAVSPTQGTWVITSYAVADAISVPLTGWLARRAVQKREEQGRMLAADEAGLDTRGEQRAAGRVGGLQKAVRHK